MFSLNEPPHKRNLHTFISTTTALLVSLLALGALVLSYNALRGVAAKPPHGRKETRTKTKKGLCFFLSVWSSGS